MIPFSHRLDWAARPNALALLVDELRARGAPLIDLTETNPTAVGLSYPDDLLARLTDPHSLRYSPHPRGLPEARRAIADSFSLLNPERLLVTASTSEAYGFLFKLLCDPGDEVLVPQPSYPLLDFLAALETVRLTPYPLRYDGIWHIDFAALAQTVTPRSRAILLVNPNNPTGSFLKRQERRQLRELATRHGLALISDEVFADYPFGDDPERVVSLCDETEALTFCLSGLSKGVGLPQLKLGWIHTSGPAEEVARALDRLELIADTYLSVATPVQYAARSLLPLRTSVGRELADRVSRHRRWLDEALRGSAIDLLPAEGGWYAILRVPRVRSEEEWALELARAGVLVQPGYFFDFVEEAYLVISLIVPTATLEAGVGRILAATG